MEEVSGDMGVVGSLRTVTPTSLQCHLLTMNVVYFRGLNYVIHLSDLSLYTRRHVLPRAPPGRYRGVRDSTWTRSYLFPSYRRRYFIREHQSTSIQDPVPPTVTPPDWSRRKGG